MSPRASQSCSAIGYLSDSSGVHQLSCIIISEGWPSWLTLLTETYLSCTKIFLSHLHFPWVSGLQSLFPGVLWHPLADFSLELFHNPQEIILCQGSHQWLQALPAALWVHPSIIGCSDSGLVGHSFDPLWTLTTLSHLSCGGATDGHFVCFTNVPWASPSHTVLPRRLRHSMEAALPLPRKSPPVPPPEDDGCSWAKAWFVTSQRKLLDWNGLLPLGRPLTPVRCRSVFSPTGWVARSLTAKELMLLWELPGSVQGVLSTWPAAHKGSLPCLSSVPTGVLRYFLSGFAGGGWLVASQLSLKPSRAISEPVWRLGEADSAISESLAHELKESTATKADDAAVPTYIWDEKMWDNQLQDDGLVYSYEQHYGKSPLLSLRNFFHRLWRMALVKNFMRYLVSHYGPDWASNPAASLDRTAGCECITSAMQSDWWEWHGGSRLFFWRWSPPHQQAARDGYPAFVKGPLPHNRKPQRAEQRPDVQKLMMEKLNKVRGRGYIQKMEVRSLTNYFAVPKGQDDIRMVFDATQSGLNAALWAPNFQLPTADTLVRSIGTGAWMGDLDVGEMFLNFCLDPALRPYCGVVLGQISSPSGKGGKRAWEAWVRCMMGLKSSPYVCIKGQLLATEVVLGNRLCLSNPFRWKVLALNLPGMPNYDPQQPKVCRWRDGTCKHLAAVLVQYVDDLRTAGATEQDCWQAMRRVTQILGYLGIQVAARKTRPPSQLPGAWAGTVIRSTENGVGVKCSLEKWERVKGILKELHESVNTQECLNRKDLERKRGVLVHVQRTYPAMTPYLKGLHQTIDSWRPDRDAEGWKINVLPEDRGYWDDQHEEFVPWVNQQDGQSLPETVKAVPRLKQDLECLQRLFAPLDPPIRYIRSQMVYEAVYGFGDASGSGFGMSFSVKGGLKYKYGVWGKDADHSSSNFRELSNLVTSLEEGVQSGDLLHGEIFIFTDNSTAESVFYKGTSTSPLLFNLVLRLRQLEMSGELKLQMIHVAGTRMIQQGTDGLSRGDLTQGVFARQRMLSFVPLHQSAIERSEGLLMWVQDWTGQPGLEPLTPEEWFDRGHGFRQGEKNSDGIWFPVESGEKWILWVPPPGAAEVAVEELNVSRHKREFINHVWLCPRLMTYQWRKKLQRVSDIVFEVPAGARPFWPASNHEPLIVGLTLSFLSHSPWQVKLKGAVLELERKLRAVWKDPAGCERSILREFLVC